MHITSEGPIKITKATIDSAWRRRATRSRLIIRDKDCRGLALIVNPHGMTWTFAYRPRGIDPLTGRRWGNKTVTLGNPETHSPDQARGEANRIKGQAAAGADPAAEKKARAEAERRKRSATLERLVDEYAIALPKRPKMRGAGVPSAAYVAIELAQVRLALEIMAATGTPAADLAPVDVRRLLDRGGEEGANSRARFGALSRFLDWCQDAGHVQSNPCAAIARARRPKAPQARSQYLTAAELARLWKATDRLREPVWRDLVRFLIAVPCRLGEAARMEWSHLNIEKAEWHQPSHMTKNRDPHRLHLHGLAMKVLEARRTVHAVTQAKGDRQKAGRIMTAGAPRSGLVFPAPVSGGVVSTFTDMKNALATATGPRDGDEEAVALVGWTWHDFRRSFASALGEAGVPEAVADAVLNHRQAATRGGVLGVYQRSSRWPEQMKAMQLWGGLLSAALGQSDASVDGEALDAVAD